LEFRAGGVEEMERWEGEVDVGLRSWPNRNVATSHKKLFSIFKTKIA
jgi:hypothetical protein